MPQNQGTQKWGSRGSRVPALIREVWQCFRRWAEVMRVQVSGYGYEVRDGVGGVVFILSCASFSTSGAEGLDRMQTRYNNPIIWADIFQACESVFSHEGSGRASGEGQL